MREKIVFTDTDRIAVVAPHPDDECLGAASVLILAPQQTDIYVLTDGSHGNPEKSVEEEAIIRRTQFENEMDAVKPHDWQWLGYEDTKLAKHYTAAEAIDFTKYTKIFLPWDKSLHPDHRAAALMCCKAIWQQKASAECFMYEINAPFYNPTHYIDITEIVEEKKQLIAYHKDQSEQSDMNISLNAYRGAQMFRNPECKYAECFMKVDAREKGYNPDLIAKLYTLREDPELEASLERKGIRIKRVMAPDFSLVYAFIRDNFAPSWADEVYVAMMKGVCHIAVKDGKILSFGCAGALAPDYAGPSGTIPEARGLGITLALCQRDLRYLKDQGFRYAIMGSVSPAARKSVEKIVDVITVEDSYDAFCELIRR